MGIIKYLWRLVWNSFIELLRFVLIVVMVCLAVLGVLKFFEGEIKGYLTPEINSTMLQEHSAIMRYGADPPVLYQSSFNPHQLSKWPQYDAELEPGAFAFPLRL